MNLRESVMKLICAAVFGPMLGAQSFEVVSIRPSGAYPAQGGANVALQGGPGTTDPTHVRWNFVCVGSLVYAAFGVKNFQVNNLSGLCEQSFDIAAAVPEGATKEDLRPMWRKLLEERFGMVAKVEKREFDGQELVVGRGGHKLVETKLTQDEQQEKGRIENGKLAGAGMILMARRVSGVTMNTAMAKARTLAPLADLLSLELNEPVVDHTGLSGLYDFEFDFAPRRGRTPDSGIDIVDAIRESLGLQLRKAQAELDYVVIEKIDRKPTEN